MSVRWRPRKRTWVDTTGARDLDGDVEQGLLARHRPFQKAVTESPHGDELFDEYSRLCKDIVLESHTRFQWMLASRLRVASRAGLIDLKPAGVSAPAAAEVLNLAAAGLKHRAPDVATFEKRVSKLVRVFMAGLR